jgi:hypothetical protein
MIFKSAVTAGSLPVIFSVRKDRICMKDNVAFSENERFYLRDLAKKQLEIATLPIMQERRKQWLAHNSLKGDRPMISMEYRAFSELMPEPVCSSDEAVTIEMQLLRNILNHKLVDDDKVIPAKFVVPWQIRHELFGLDIECHVAQDSLGRGIGHVFDHPIHDLKEDFHKLGRSRIKLDRERTMAEKAFAEDILGDILPVKVEEHSLQWFTTPTAKVIYLMGMEQFLFAMMDYPDEIRDLFRRMESDFKDYFRFLEDENLLSLNNGNHYAGAGSYGFTDELPTPACKQSGKITTKDLWGNMNSQETVGISPEMFKEFVFPIYHRLAEEFGLVYYGCCEPVHDIWDDCIANLPNLRKVSISAWCNEEFMGERLKEGTVIYSRKPRANYLSFSHFDEKAFAAHITKTLQAAKGCKLEILFRDIMTVGGDAERPGKAIKIVRNLIDQYWS